MLKEKFKEALKKYLNNAEEVYNSIDFSEYFFAGHDFTEFTVSGWVKVEIREDKREKINNLLLEDFTLEKLGIGAKVIFLIIDIELQKKMSVWSNTEEEGDFWIRLKERRYKKRKKKKCKKRSKKTKN